MSTSDKYTREEYLRFIDETIDEGLRVLEKIRQRLKEIRQDE